jgi:hypothetical protein
MTQNEKRFNTFHSNWAKKSIKIQFSIYFKVYFLTIFALSLYSELRRQYINKNYWVHRNYIKFAKLINTTNEVDIKK